jgi:hypothetical protein
LGGCFCLGKFKLCAGLFDSIGDGHGMDFRLLRGEAAPLFCRVDCIAVLNDGYAVDGRSPLTRGPALNANRTT